jgi:hypothetical protein
MYAANSHIRLWRNLAKKISQRAAPLQALVPSTLRPPAFHLSPFTFHFSLLTFPRPARTIELAVLQLK